ncbi:hypothetical protein [Rhodococcus globerulus]|uniref:hypothetical protein n=1 Tax=Rhodococcus globerulus TaxID=33008 RepID=UPI0015865086|nr:hypothetical protein [Rhodococcus globerulus]
MVRFGSHRFDIGEIATSFLFDGHAEDDQDAPGSFDDGTADYGAFGDGLELRR